MSEPTLVPRDALNGKTVGISVSDSADLSRLGLTSAHCEFAVAELARAIFLAGGRIIYGGRLVEPGFTDILLDELMRYREDRDALVLCIPETEHRRLSDDELLRRRSTLQVSAELICLDSAGTPVDLDNREESRRDVDAGSALTAMRKYITKRCDARVVVGGRLQGYQGAMPGVIEETLMSLEASKPIYVSGGFGGAAAAVAVAVGSDDGLWFPPDFPEGAETQSAVLSQFGRLSNGMAPDGLDDKERHQLAVSHRPGDISSLVVTGLGRLGRVL